MLKSCLPAGSWRVGRLIYSGVWGLMRRAGKHPLETILEQRIAIIDHGKLVACDTTTALVNAVDDKRLTLVLAEQNAAAALRLADDAHILEYGRLVHSGTGLDLLEDPRLQQAGLTP